jgi:hypothetical protein
MAVTYGTTLKNARLQLVSDLIAGKTAAASTGSASAGKLVIGTSALSGATGVLATIDLPTTPFVVSGGVATLQGVPLSATPSAAGTAAKAEIRNNAGNVIVSGLTVGTSGANVIVTDARLVETVDVVVTATTITHS